MRKGSKHTEESKIKIRSYKHSEDAKKRISDSCKKNGVGRWNKGTSYNKGRPVSPDTRKKISDSLKGRKMPYVSEANSKRVYSDSTKLLRSLVMKKNWSNPKFRERLISSVTGENNPRWVFDRTAYQEKCRIRGTLEWKNWRETIFKRDNYTCQDCGQIGGCLEPHHIIPIRVDQSKLFDLRNGITLCRTCHKKTMFKEENFQERYEKIVLENSIKM